jgi:hypothetical protein
MTGGHHGQSHFPATRQPVAGPDDTLEFTPPSAPEAPIQAAPTFGPVPEPTPQSAPSGRSLSRRQIAAAAAGIGLVVGVAAGFAGAQVADGPDGDRGVTASDAGPGANGPGANGNGTGTGTDQQSGRTGQGGWGADSGQGSGQFPGGPGGDDQQGQGQQTQGQDQGPWGQQGPGAAVRRTCRGPGRRPGRRRFARLDGRVADVTLGTTIPRSGRHAGPQARTSVAAAVTGFAGRPQQPRSTAPVC